MRKLIYIVSAALIFTALYSVQAHAQEQKIGYVDTDFILSKIPDYKNIEQELKTVSQQWRNQLEQMQKEIDQLKEDFSSKEILYTDEIRKQKKEEINRKVQQRQQYLEQKFGSNGEYFKKQQELLEPIQQDVYNAISVIAGRDGFDFIFDRSQNTSLLFTKKEWNLNAAVLTELGISVDKTSN